MQRVNRLSMLIYWPYAILQILVSKCFCILEQNIVFTLSLPFHVHVEHPQVCGLFEGVGFLGLDFLFVLGFVF